MTNHIAQANEMKRTHPKVRSAIADGAIRPRRISPPPDDERWLHAPLLDAAFAWRLVQTTVADLEQRPTFSPHSPPIRPDWQPWKDFKTTIQENDELWLFSSPKKLWHTGMGSDGVLLVRNSEPIRFIVLAFN